MNEKLTFIKLPQGTIKDVIVIVHAKHLFWSSRGIKDKESATTTVDYGVFFEKESYRNEFLSQINPKSIV